MVVEYEGDSALVAKIGVIIRILFHVNSWVLFQITV